MIFMPSWSSLDLLDFTFLNSWSPFAAFNGVEETSKKQELGEAPVKIRLTKGSLPGS